MGKASRDERHNPKRLASKLKQIRVGLDLTQAGMVEQLGNPEALLQTSISGYERGARVPPLLILLKYAQLAGVSVDVLLDDSVDLSSKLPSNPKRTGAAGRPTHGKTQRKAE
ncbi:MAG: helix-turn-helix transcriptional regulator [Blastocatellia bacterium]